MTMSAQPSARDDPERRARDAGDDRRVVILETAARLFQQRGYSGTTVRDLAREVGITSGSIFHHFGSKEDVLLSVVERGLREATLRIDDQAEAADPRKRLRHMIHAHLSALLDGSPETMSVLFHERWSLSDGAWRRMVERRDSYEALWDAALADLGDGYGDPSYRKLSRLLLMGAMNWSAQWYRPDGEFDIDAVTDALLARYVS